MFSGEAKSGGISFLINSTWCLDVAVLASSCSSELKYITVKCHPYYPSWEFNLAILIIVYIPAHADAKLALVELCTVTNSLETK